MFIRHQIQIDAPIDKVFDILELEGNPKRWIEQSQHSQTQNYNFDPVKAQKRRFGSRFDTGGLLRGRMDMIHAEVTSRQKPTYLSAYVEGDKFRMDVEYHLSEITTDSTILNIQVALKFTSRLMKFFGELFGGFSHSVLVKKIKQLKQIAESSSGPKGFRSSWNS